MRPPWASTIPLQMARPRPVSPAASRSSQWENLRNRRGRSSVGIPRPRSATETSTCTPVRTADTWIAEDSGECLAALDSRLAMTWTMRLRSAITGGRSGPTSISRLFRPPASWKAFLARSTSAATPAGSGSTGSVPVSMRATSTRPPRGFRWASRRLGVLMRTPWSTSPRTT